MKWKKRVTVLLAILMVFAVSSVVYGHDVPDLEKEGSITVSMTYSERPVSGGTLTLYRVGDVVSDDGDYSFVLSEEFAGSRLSLDDIQSDQLAKQLASYAKENRLDGVTGSIGSSGKILFQKVKPGLYLLVQSQAADGYLAADPFLVSMPAQKDGVYLYDVDASPKTELEKAPAKPTPTKPAPSKLPQTGQLNWPIPVLAAAGLTLCVIGWRLHAGSRRDGHEN